MLYTQLAALALTAATLVASGCGGSSKTTSATTSAAPAASTAPATTEASSSTTASGAPLTRAELIAKAEPICTRTAVELKATSALTNEELVRALHQAAAYNQAEAIELGKLIPPSSMTNDWKQIVTGMHTYSKAVTKVANSIAANNPTATKALLEAARADHKRVLAITTRNGFKACAAP
jgi:hypothetical protein